MKRTSPEGAALSKKPPPPEYGPAPKLELLMAFIERMKRRTEEKAAALEQKTA